MRAKWPMELAIISGFCSVKWMRYFDSSLDGTLIHCRLASSRCWYSFIYPGMMESWVSLGRKGCTNVSNLRRAVNRPGSLWSKGRERSYQLHHLRPPESFKYYLLNEFRTIKNQNPTVMISVFFFFIFKSVHKNVTFAIVKKTLI
mgnify:CR=1 FL=1